MRDKTTYPIAFIAWLPAHFFLYKRVLKILPEAEVIIDATHASDSTNSSLPVIQLKELLSLENIPFRIFYKTRDKCETFFKESEILISNIRSTAINSPANSQKKQIRIDYGYSKDLWTYGTWNRYFDLALAHGPYTKDRLSSMTNAVITGASQFDGWFSNDSFQHDPGIVSKMDPRKKTLLYLPTHGDLSSIAYITGLLSQITAAYNLIVKPHPLSFYHDAAFLLAYQNEPKVILLNDTYNIAEIFHYADIVLSDNSGSIFESVLVNKPVVIADFWNEEYLLKEHSQMKQIAPRHWKIPLTYEKSIEQRIKHEPDLTPGPIIRSANDLMRSIEEGLYDSSKYEPARSKLSEMLFSYRDGTATNRVANAIKSLLGKPKPERNFLSLRVSMEIIRADKGLDEEIEYLEGLIQGKEIE